MTASTATLAHGNLVSRGFRRFIRARETSILLAVVIVVAITAIKNPAFLFSREGWRDLLLAPSIVVLLAIGQAVVIISRNVDLSVGSVLGLTAFLTGTLFIKDPGIPIIVVFVIGLVVGGLLGFINGALVAFARVPALVITLGTVYAYRGIDVVLTGAGRIDAFDMPKAFLALGTQQFLTIPFLAIIAFVVLIAAGWLMRNLRSGREFYAIGSDPEAAILYGLKVTRRVVAALVLSGALAGVAGVLYAARYGTVDSQAGTGIELQAIGAAVIGGVAIFGGSGTVWGAAIGGILLLTINRALPILGVPDFWQRSVVGVLIIGAIVLDRLLFLQHSHRLLKERDKSDD